jgi:DNA-directed RNA polymerase subunit RPC12/RpoP
VIGIVARRHPIDPPETSQAEGRMRGHGIVGLLTEGVLQSRGRLCHPRPAQAREGRMKETRKVHYVKGVFVCPKCRQSYLQEKWIEEWRVRCHKCDYRGTLTEVSVEERMEEEIVRR